MKKTVFDYSDYKEFIRSAVNSPDNTRGYHGRLAQAAGMHSSFLSKVLNSHVHLTPDQGADMCIFWNLTGEETLFFLNLVHWARAGSSSLRSILGTQIEKSKKQREKLVNRFSEAAHLESEKAGQYYSAWHLMCVHLILLIPKFRTADKIAERLLISQALVDQALLFLKNLGLVEEVGGKWRCKQVDVHLGNDSYWASVHHNNWHAKSILKIQENCEQLVNFSSVIVISKKTAEQIKKLLLDELEDLRKIVKEAPEDEMYFLGVNFYEI